MSTKRTYESFVEEYRHEFLTIVARALFDIRKNGEPPFGDLFAEFGITSEYEKRYVEGYADALEACESKNLEV